MYREQTHHLRPGGAAVAWRLPLLLLALAVAFLPAAGLLAAQADAAEEQVEEQEAPAEETEEAADKADSETDAPEEGKAEAESKDKAEKKPEKSQQDESKEEQPAEEQGKTKGAEETKKMTSSKASDSKASKPVGESNANVEVERPQEVEPPAKKANKDGKKPEPPKKEKCIIGSTATLLEKQTGLKFRARIDTGAKSSSLHVEKMTIENESTKTDVAERMTENIGKVITFEVKNGSGEAQPIKRKIAGYVIIKNSNSDEGERRYKVPITFIWKNMEKEVLVTLNDRNHMKYPLLLGRNFLRGDFLVDVELNSDD